MKEEKKVGVGGKIKKKKNAFHNVTEATSDK